MSLYDVVAGRVCEPLMFFLDDETPLYYNPQRSNFIFLSEVVETVQQVHCSRSRLLRRGLVVHVCTINKSAHTKMSGNLSYAPHMIQNIVNDVMEEPITPNSGSAHPY